MVMIAVTVFVVVRVTADLYGASAESASTFLAHIRRSPLRRFPIRVRAATRRLGCGTADIRSKNPHLEIPARTPRTSTLREWFLFPAQRWRRWFRDTRHQRRT